MKTLMNFVTMMSTLIMIKIKQIMQIMLIMQNMTLMTIMIMMILMLFVSVLGHPILLFDLLSHNCWDILCRNSEPHFPRGPFKPIQEYASSGLKFQIECFLFPRTKAVLTIPVNLLSSYTRVGPIKV